MRTKLFLLFFCCLLVFAFTPLTAQTESSSKPDTATSNASRPPSSPEVREAIAKGQELLFQKDVKGGIASFKKAVELDPQYVRGHVLLGNAYMQAQQWADAQAAFEKASRLAPNDVTALLGLGSALNQQQDWSGALKPLTQCLRLKTDSAEGHYEIARSLMGLERMQDAELHVRMSIELNGKYALPHILMGDVYLHLHENAEGALAEYQEYLRLDPDGPSSAPVKAMIAKLQKMME
jgi:tetratricopeptide (TPR) repeat protein